LEDWNTSYRVLKGQEKCFHKGKTPKTAYMYYTFDFFMSHSETKLLNNLAAINNL